MDVRPLVRKAQCMHLSEGQDVRCSTQLGDLPDKILWHILSFLRLKDVVRTSTLSKRWEHLSKNNPRLDASELDFPGQTLFVNFVDTALLLQDFPLKRFSISCQTDFDRSHIDAWITAAVRRRVEELHVRRHGGLLEYVLPSCVFNCETLIELRLFMLHQLRLPALVCLKNLKVLTLAWVDFGGDSSVEKLLSCPSLEELSLIACKWRRLKVLHISAPKLLRLDIVEDSFYKNLESTFYVGIHGAHIESFTYSGQFIDRYTISSSSSLVVARIDMFICERPHHHAAYHGYKLLKDLSCVKRLSLHNVGEFLHERPDLLKSLPVFSNLTELALDAFNGLPLESRFLVAMLDKCPRLSHLSFTRGIPAESETVDAIFNPAPRCFVSSLKVIKISRFQVGDKALLAIRNVLRTAGVLEKLFIHPPWGKQLPESLLPLLKELPRASDQCEFFLGS
ncbi:F-box protein At4g22280-like [Syzygium oleosum]|uniref:F-box protein At4g22280-like n=1 Tax=Syzygium oleosum TaxID=219896 RepID=UPI0024B99D60|nr:F-box protein At4g22280-like [Syzygium oleosum]